LFENFTKQKKITCKIEGLKYCTSLIHEQCWKPLKLDKLIIKKRVLVIRNLQLFALYLPRPTLVLQDEKLIRDRRASSCALIKGKDGFPVVAIVGGVEVQGMELWNPQTREVKLLWEEIPPELGAANGFFSSDMLLINGGSELILYGGRTGSYKDEIWKYTMETNNWTVYKNYVM